jgi:glycosyltransferase involved in cell wall biosynthesis
MKIAFLNIYQGKQIRGAEIFVSELSYRLAKKHEIVLYAGRKAPAPRWPILWRAFIDPHGIQNFIWTLKQLPKIWRTKPDVVLPLNGAWQPALVRILTWLYGGKMVISGQSGKGWDDRNNLWCFPNAFVALSQELSLWAKKANPFVRVVHIPNGVNTKKFKPKGNKIEFKLGKPIILCVGALTDEKRIDLAIKAVAKLKKGSLLVVGQGPLKDKLNKLGKRLLGRRFLIKKYAYEKMPQIYRGANIFTLPSPSFRAFEIVIVEALATGLGVVVNDDPIRREIVGKAGKFVDPLDTQEYAKALKEVLKRGWTKIARKQAEKFDWDKITKDYESLFKEITK